METITILLLLSLYFLFWYDIKIYMHAKIVKSKRNESLYLKNIRNDEQLIALLEKIKFPDAKRIFMNGQGRATIETENGKYSFVISEGKLTQAKYTEIKGIDGYIEEELIKKYMYEYALDGSVAKSTKAYKKAHRNNAKLALSFVSAIVYCIILVLIYI